MTEAEWMTCADPTLMLEFLRNVKSPKGRARSRKFRLLLVACCLRSLHLLPDSRSRNAVLVAELHAQGHATRQELKRACQQAEAVSRELKAIGQEYINRHYFHSIASYVSATTIVGPERVVNEFLGFVYAASDDSIMERRLVSSLLRDSFNPFCPVVNPSWLTADVRTLAQGISAEKAFDRMPILADALQDAGCDNADILDHCRQPGEHVRGCWVIDLLTGRK